jgi:hypothetical protein
MRRDERSVRAVPGAVLGVLIAAFASVVSWQAAQSRPAASAEALSPPPSVSLLRVASAGEPAVLAGAVTLYLQAFDNQPGISIPFMSLDYPRVIRWLATILELDPRTQYPLLMAAHLYGQVPDPERERVMFGFVHDEFLRDPNRRWRWLANAAIAAKHRLHDPQLALAYANDIARYAPGAPGWARQMHVFILEDMGELESAKILLGGLIESGEVTDPHELNLLVSRLEELKRAEKSSLPSRR